MSMHWHTHLKMCGHFSVPFAPLKFDFNFKFTVTMLNPVNTQGSQISFRYVVLF